MSAGEMQPQPIRSTSSRDGGQSLRIVYKYPAGAAADPDAMQPDSCPEICRAESANNGRKDPAAVKRHQLTESRSKTAAIFDRRAPEKITAGQISTGKRKARSGDSSPAGCRNNAEGLPADKISSRPRDPDSIKRGTRTGSRAGAAGDRGRVYE